MCFIWFQKLSEYFSKQSFPKEETDSEWDDDCRVGTGEQLELDVEVEEQLEVGVGEDEAGAEVFCNSAEKDEEEELHVT